MVLSRQHPENREINMPLAVSFLYPLTGIVTVFAALVLLWTGILAGGARAKNKVPAPLMDGPEPFMRAMRVQANSVEQAVIYLPMLWLFAGVVGDFWAAAIGVFWPIGRIIYALGYLSAANKRSTGFLIGFAATAVLTLGNLFFLVRGLL
jgi:glutathione S-transferase